MKRLMIRLAVLSVVVALGLIAIAQARFGKENAAENQLDSPADLANASSPQQAPGEIPSSLADLQPEPAGQPASSDGQSTPTVDYRGNELGQADYRATAQNTAALNTADEIPNYSQLPAATAGAMSEPPVENTLGVSSPQGQSSTSNSGVMENPYRRADADPRYAGSLVPAGTETIAQVESSATAEPGYPSTTPAYAGQPNESVLPTLSANDLQTPLTEPAAATDAVDRFAENDLGAGTPAAGSGFDSTNPTIQSMPPADDYRNQPNSLGASSGGSATDFGGGSQPNDFAGAAPADFAAPGDFQADGLLPRQGLSPVAGGLGGASLGEPALEGASRPGSKELEGPQSPIVTVVKVAPEAVQVGKECVFTITVRNDGVVPAHQVRIIDSIPEGTQYVSSSPQASQLGDGQLVWVRDTLEPGEELTIDLRLTPISEGELGSVARVEFETHATARVVATKPAISLQLTAPKTVMIGGTASIKIEISNPGTGPATGVMLLENVPAGLRHSAGQALEFEVGTLAPGESRELELFLTAEQAGRVTNTISARADANLQVEQSVELEVVAPDLQVAVDGPSVRYLERQAVYTVAINNPGTAAADDVELVTHLPKGMKFVQANNQGHYDPVTHAVYWGLEHLPAHETGQVELTTIPVEAGDQTLRVEGKAAAGLADEVRQTVKVEGLVAIRFEVVDLQDPIEIGAETTYEIRVVNQGTKAATNVRVAALLPPGMQAVSADGPARHELSEDQVLFEPLRKLAPKADTTYHVKVKGARAGDHRIRVQIVTDEVTEPVTKEESTQVYGDQ